MTFNDVFKSNFLEKVASTSPLDMAISLLFAFALGLFVFYVYRKTFNGVMYSQSFGISLMAMTLITTLIILAVTSNVVLSLGMVGALSIVRFRTAVKEPMDIAFLFWSISVGIVTGAGFVVLAVFGSVFIGIVLMVFVNRKSRDNPYIVIISCENEKAEAAATGLIKDSVGKALVKSKTVSKNGIELTMEIRLKEDSTSFVNSISEVEGVSNAVLVSYNGEYMS